MITTEALRLTLIRVIRQKENWNETSPSSSFVLIKDYPKALYFIDENLCETLYETQQRTQYRLFTLTNWIISRIEGCKNNLSCKIIISNSNLACSWSRQKKHYETGKQTFFNWYGKNWRLILHSKSDNDIEKIVIFAFQL